jgi:hypothetical protein
MGRPGPKGTAFVLHHISMGDRCGQDESASNCRSQVGLAQGTPAPIHHNYRLISWSAGRSQVGKSISTFGAESRNTFLMAYGLVFAELAAGYTGPAMLL